MPEPTKADASTAVEQTRAIWTAAFTELAQYGILHKQD